ncbi:MAG: F0F1 ATP synthase subunit A [Nitrospirota bacterium]|jgi:F-type H+-transporting ATPase subunit a
MKKITVFPEVIFSIGPVRVTDTVVDTWIVMAIIAGAFYLITRRLSTEPSLAQEALEAVIDAIVETIREVLPIDPWRVVPVVGTLWIFIGFANLAGLVPGLDSPTADLNTTAAFAIISYLSSHAYGISTEGLRGYLRHYTRPTWVLLPFHLVSEATRTVAMAIRLFGNMISGEMVGIILLGVMGLLAPVPFELLHLIIGVIQAFIFGMLTLVFIAGGLRHGE